MARITRNSIRPCIESVQAQDLIKNGRSERLFTDLVVSVLNGARPHSADSSYTVVPHAYYRGMSTSPLALNEQLGQPFEVLEHDPGKRTATGFKLREDVAIHLGDLVGETPIHVDTGRKVMRQKNAVAFKDSRGARATFKLALAQEVHVDLIALHDKALSDDPIEAENAKAILRQSPDGIFLQQYEESASGRLFGKGINLQSVKSSVRRAAMPSGAIEFDIENAHGMGLNWLAKTLGYKTSILQIYADDPVSIRNALSEDLGIGYDDAKQIVLMSIYLAGINTGIKQMVVDAGGNPDALQGLFKSLWKDIRGAGRHVIKHGQRGK
ncbi:MAG: hypothetical protein P8N43_05150, partial [Alphaproteobacteria bacterium]|nr:hypothetical protein [Alphaproteobacteria bacterium]